jgi:hypothetical protein
MIANAEQAIEQLRHKRTGEVMPTKNVARNTKLIYYADELVGLKLHDTVIAMYRPDGVVIDTRGGPSLLSGYADDSPTGQGWFTAVTWQRIDTFTPARTFTANGLRYFRPPGANWDLATARLYAHGTQVSSDGSCTFPLDPAIEREISRVVRTFPRKLRRHADRVVDRWLDWARPEKCCLKAATNPEDANRHYLSHVEQGEPMIPYFLSEVVEHMRSRGFYGDELTNELRERLIERFEPFTLMAIKSLAPEFPYPQVEKRQR